MISLMTTLNYFLISDGIEAESEPFMFQVKVFIPEEDNRKTLGTVLMHMLLFVSLCRLFAAKRLFLVATPAAVVKCQTLGMTN